jgi:molecular chaperone GrpE
MLRRSPGWRQSTSPAEPEEIGTSAPPVTPQTDDTIVRVLRQEIGELDAEFRNYRDRTNRQRDELVAAGVAELVTDLLDVLDHAELWAVHVAAEQLTSPEATALSRSQEVLVKALSKNGLQTINESGVTFDPLLHDPLELEDDESNPGPTVETILRPGYTFRGIVIRPALIRLRA